MFRNYLKTAWRNLVKNKTFSFINIAGLALGLACSILIMLWVLDERSVDAFHKNDSQLYAIYERQYHDGQIDGGYYTPGILADELKITMPEVEYATGMAWNELNTFEANGKILKQDGNYAGADFFLMFSYPLLKGESATALKTPQDIAISRKMAESFFGSVEEAFGKTIRYENRKDMTVSAVFENIQSNSSHKFDYLLNWETFLENNSWARDWGNNGPSTFIMLKQGTDAVAFDEKIRDFMDLHRENQHENFIIKLALQKYSDQYLYSNFKHGEIAGGRIEYVTLFSIIAVFILLIACINFMNLTTARSVKRSKEIGVRKVVGAARKGLIKQFLGEAVLTVACAFVVSWLLVILVMPLFNSVTLKQIELPFDQPFFLASLLCLMLLTGFLSGSYPALYLSSFNPVRAFKGALKFSTGVLWLRKGLVVFQFVLSTILIVGTIVISRQVNYIQSVNLGYDRENLIYVPLEGDLVPKYTLFKDRALTMPGIQTMSRVTQNPTSIQNGTGGVEWEGKDPNSVLQFTQAAVGYDFMKTMKIQIKEGRDFSEDFASDSVGYIVNETALKIIGYKDPVGMPLTFWQRKGIIVGVVNDFHFNSLHKAINPLVIRLGEDVSWGWAVIRTEAGKTEDALASLGQLCKELNPQVPFTYKFSDQEYEEMYKSEQVVTTLSNVFALLAIFISCLGLLGLTMFTAEQRTKEIGIRKILGASVTSLFNLLSKELVVLVVIALLIASPLAWIVMNDWLSEYAYKINISWWVFAVAGMLVMMITLLTVSFQTIKALLANPVNSLRSE